MSGASRPERFMQKGDRIPDPGRSIMTDWVEMCVGVAPESEEAISNALCELGSNGVAWKEDDRAGSVVAGYFPAGKRIEEAAAAIRTLWTALGDLGLAAGACRVALRPVPVREWTTGWQEWFRPIFISGRLVVKPPWAELPAREGRIVIEIAPGMAFGTGEHETTRLCLGALDRLARPGDRVLDAGTGSGILAITAAKLGARCVVAVDVDDTAVEGAKENVLRNGVEDRVEVYHGGVDHPTATGSFRLIVSNIDTRTHIGLFARYARLLDQEGFLILSGILNTESGTIVRHLGDHGFTLMEQAVMGEWWGGVAVGPRE